MWLCTSSARLALISHPKAWGNLIVRDLERLRSISPSKFDMLPRPQEELAPWLEFVQDAGWSWPKVLNRLATMYRAESVIRTSTVMHLANIQIDSSFSCHARCSMRIMLGIMGIAMLLGLILMLRIRAARAIHVMRTVMLQLHTS